MLEDSVVIHLIILSALRVIVGVGLLFVVVGSLYRFQKSVLTLMGFLLLSNLLSLYLILGLLST